jgi:iron(III) transport system ATP-binding protein
MSVDLQINNLSLVREDFTILDSVSLSVKGGTTLALLGPSGCGKTTLLRLIAGLEAPDAGTISAGGSLLTDTHILVSPEDRRVGMVFQDGALFPHLSVAENVAYGLTRSQVKTGRVQEVLEMVDLSGFDDRRPASLSGGQAQRVAVARALAPHPSVLLLDEPFSSLDAELRIRVRADLVRLLDDLEITTVFVTHDQEEAFVVGEEIAIMNEGRLLQQGTSTEIYDAPLDPWLARFVGDVNLLSAQAHSSGALTSLGVLPTIVPLESDGVVMVRPEYLKLAPGDGATVCSVEFYGHDTSYVLEGIGEPLLVRELQGPRFEVGESVRVIYSGGPAMAFAEHRPG